MSPDVGEIYFHRFDLDKPLKVILLDYTTWEEPVAWMVDNRPGAERVSVPFVLSRFGEFFLPKDEVDAKTERKRKLNQLKALEKIVADLRKELGLT